MIRLALNPTFNPSFEQSASSSESIACISYLPDLSSTDSRWLMAVSALARLWCKNRYGRKRDLYWILFQFTKSIQAIDKAGDKGHVSTLALQNSATLLTRKSLDIWQQWTYQVDKKEKKTLLLVYVSPYLGLKKSSSLSRVLFLSLFGLQKNGQGDIFTYNLKIFPSKYA